MVGVDHVFQKNYPFEFHEADFFEYVEQHGHLYDAIHASPPCQAYSVARNLSRGAEFRHDQKRKSPSPPMLLGRCRQALEAAGRPYVIENVVGARRHMRNPVMLCGSMFGLDVQRHRLFDSNLLLFGSVCRHDLQEPRFPPSSPSRTNLLRVICVIGHGGIQPGVTREMRHHAMGIDWPMTNQELSESIPPAFTHEIGTQLLWHLEGEAAS